jgi:hypothetical protein
VAAGEYEIRPTGWVLKSVGVSRHFDWAAGCKTECRPGRPGARPTVGRNRGFSILLRCKAATSDRLRSKSTEFGLKEHQVLRSQAGSACSS